jgi:hypothetical protein
MSTHPFPFFDRLSPIVYLHAPASHRHPGDTSPDLIILATWMDAPVKLINTYANSYRTHFPSSRILLLITSYSHIFVTSTTAYDSLLRPALPLLQAAKGRIVSSVYSNGGAIALTSLARLSATATGHILPLQALILDSTPGSGTDIDSGIRAVSALLPPALRRSILGYIVNLLLRLTLGGYWLLLALQRKVDPITRLRHDLLNDRIIPVGCRRTYIYSKADEIISSTVIQQHAREAEAKGLTVRREMWESSGHVAHARADGQRYWEVVKETLNG